MIIDSDIYSLVLDYAYTARDFFKYNDPKSIIISKKCIKILYDIKKLNLSSKTKNIIYYDLLHYVCTVPNLKSIIMLLEKVRLEGDICTHELIKSVFVSKNAEILKYMMDYFDDNSLIYNVHDEYILALALMTNLEIVKVLFRKFNKKKHYLRGDDASYSFRKKDNLDIAKYVFLLLEENGFVPNYYQSLEEAMKIENNEKMLNFLFEEIEKSNIAIRWDDRLFKSACRSGDIKLVKKVYKKRIQRNDEMITCDYPECFITWNIEIQCFIMGKEQQNKFIIDYDNILFEAYVYCNYELAIYMLSCRYITKKIGIIDIMKYFPWNDIYRKGYVSESEIKLIKAIKEHVGANHLSQIMIPYGLDRVRDMLEL